MMILLAVLGIALFALLVLSRLLVLAPTRAGRLMYLANVVLETFEKRSHQRRAVLDALILIAASALIGIAFGAMRGSRTAGVAAALAAVSVFLLLVLENLMRERRILREVHAAQESVGLQRASSSQQGYPSPGLHPRLSVNLEGPFVSRSPKHDLGVLVPGQPIPISILIGNHSRVPTQTSVQLRVTVPKGLGIVRWGGPGPTTIASGHVDRHPITVVPSVGAAPGRIRITVSSSRFWMEIHIRHAGCREIGADELASAEITRYPGARRAAFAWRGDMDLYDTATFQTIEGLEDAFGLGARYGVAQTMYLSTRLSLDHDAAKRWAKHYGVDRGAEQIPRFIEWMRRRVELRHSAPYPATPAESAKPFVIELGNHGHLHYATDTSGDPGNEWKAGARAGEGYYSWQSGEKSSLNDQRSNALEAARWCRELFGFEMRSWAKPGRGNDAFSAAAVEAAGCEVVTGSDIRPRDNVLRQPPPHHPTGTKVVELTARYPSDPQHIQHLAMLEYWLHRGHRLGIPVVMLVHQHMRQWDGAICEAMTEHMLNLAVNGFHGDLFIDTVYGIGRYWLDVLSPTTRCVEVRVEAGAVIVANRSDRTIRGVPIDLTLRNGERLTRLVDLEPGETRVALGAESAPS